MGVYVDTAVCMSWRSFLESSAGKHHALYVLNLVHVLYGVQLVKKYSRKQKAPKTNNIGTNSTDTWVLKARP
jgi:hypothetical protein